MTRLAFGALCASFVFCTNIVADTPVDAGMLFFDAFASKCSSMGPFSSRALADTKTLESIVRVIKEDKECEGMANLIDSIVTASTQYEVINHGTPNEEKTQLEEYQKRLSISYALATDPMEQMTLQQELADVQLRLIQLPTLQQDKRYEERQNAMSNMTNYLREVSDHYTNQMNCFEKHKALPVQLGLQLLALSGGFFDPTINVAVTLAGRLFNSFLNFFSNWELDRQIKDYRKTTMEAGLSCAMEALEQTLCDIQDQAKLVETLVKYRDEDPMPEAWMGYDILKYDYPIVQDFLKKVETGADPQSADQAGRRISFRSKEIAFRSARDQALGLMAEAENDLKAIDLTTPDEAARKSRKKNILRDLIESLTGSLVVGSSNFFSSAVPSSNKYEGMKYWLRINAPNPDKGDQSIAYDFENRLDRAETQYTSSDAVILMDVDLMRRRFRAIEKDAQANLNLERAKTINPDKEGALFQWTVETNNKRSPGALMKKIVDFLHVVETTWVAHPEWFSTLKEQETQLSLVRSTSDKFEKTLQIIVSEDDPSTLDIREDLPQTKLNAIFDIMQLSERDQVITSRLNDIVEQDLIHRVKDGLLKQDPFILDTMVRLSTRSLVNSLTPGTNEQRTASLTKIQDDIFNSNTYANANLYFFYKHYGETVVFILEYLKDIAFQYAPRVVKTKGRANFIMPDSTSEGAAFSRICILALNDPNLDENTKLVNECSGRTLSFKRASGETATDYYDKPLQVSFDKVYAEDPSDRSCVFRRYQNRRDLYETLRDIKPIGFKRGRPPKDYSGRP